MPATTVYPQTDAAVDDRFTQYAFAFAFISSAALLISIAVAHICLAAAALFLLLSKTRLQLPPVALPLGGFLGFTLLSVLASDDPAASWPQLKKFFVFLTLPIVFSLFPRWDQARRLIEAWFVCGLAAAVLSVVQFLQKAAAARAAGENFYEAYIHRRITGFFSHWMTFSEVGMLVFLILLSYLLFSASGRKYGRAVWFACGLILGLSLALSFTRGVWLATAAAGGYLLWHWNRKLLLAGPVALAVAFIAAPGAAKQRLVSIVNLEANSARLIMWRTGLQMIETHPWFGVGPERVGPRFQEFMPKEINELPPAYYAHLHNIYVHYAAERGLPAAAMLLWLLVKIWLDHRRALRWLPSRPSDDRFLLHAVAACTLGIAVAGCFDLSLGDSEILGFYLALIALGYRRVERFGALASQSAT